MKSMHQTAVVAGQVLTRDQMSRVKGGEYGADMPETGDGGEAAACNCGCIGTDRLVKRTKAELTCRSHEGYEYGLNPCWCQAN